jgi:hypothetical protein
MLDEDICMEAGRVDEDAVREGICGPMTMAPAEVESRRSPERELVTVREPEGW